MLSPEVYKIINKFENSPYKIQNGPWIREENCKEPDLSEGINCQYFYHEFLEATSGFQLPPNMLSKEIYEDDELFPPIIPNDLDTADVFMFGGNIDENELDPRTLHLAAFVGNDINNKPLLIHFFGRRECIDVNGNISPEDTGLQIWTIDKFRDKKDYCKIWSVKRFDPEVHIYRVPPHLPNNDEITSFFKRSRSKSSS